MTPEELQDYITQYNSAMTPGGAATAVSSFQNSGNYANQFGSGFNQYWNSSPLQQLTQTPSVKLEDFLKSDAYRVQYGDNQSTDPNQRFQNDPGVQMAIKAGMPALANSYGAKGLGASGPAANGVAQYMYNNYLNFTGKQGDLYNQEYNKAATSQQQQAATYLQQQQLMGNTFQNYQNQLAALGGQGAQTSNQQAQNQYQSGQNLANLLAQLNQNTGNISAQSQLSVNELISQLLANQGVLNANGYLGTGAAMSGNILAGSQLGAQLANAQNKSNAGTTNSLLAGQGAQAGASQLYGLGGGAYGTSTYK